MQRKILVIFEVDINIFRNNIID